MSIIDLPLSFRNQWLEDKIFNSADDLYAYLVSVMTEALRDLDLTRDSEDFKSFSTLCENFRVSTEDLEKNRQEMITNLQNSVRDFPDIHLWLSHRWVSSLTSVFFMIEPMIINNNHTVVLLVWEALSRPFIVSRDFSSVRIV